MSNTRVPGHTLQYEGAAFRKNNYGQWCTRYSSDGVAGTGHGICSCGETSPELASGKARKQWHREHKADVIAEATR